MVIAASEKANEVTPKKNLFTIVIRSVAITYFIFTGQIVWRDAILMAVGAITGGYADSIFRPRLKESVMRWIMVAIGAAVAAAMFVKLIGGLAY